MSKISDFIKKKKNENVQYKANFANPYKRFISYAIDSTIIYSIIVLLSFFIVRDDIREEIRNFDEEESTTFEINNNNIVNVENSKNTLEKKHSIIEKIVTKKLIQSKLFRYIALFIPVIYYMYFLYYKQRTLGENLLNLVVVRSDGQKLNFNDVFNRVFLFIISKNIFIAPITIILPIFTTKNKITLYDFFTNTYVIEVFNE